MKSQWNWQQKGWPRFKYDYKALRDFEAEFLKRSGIVIGAFEHLNEADQKKLTVQIFRDEALKTSEIEGEYLNRDSLQSSIRYHLGLSHQKPKSLPAENGIAEMMINLYQLFQRKLSHSMLFAWHKMLMLGRRDLKKTGGYRTHPEPMQVVSGYIHKPVVYFEAPPSRQIKKEMDQFVVWFNQTAPSGSNTLPALIRAGMAHLYFVSIHPFEDGNGRIGRAVAEKALSQSVGHPILLALSQIIQSKRKAYYQSLERNNKTLEITPWLIYFSKTLLEAIDNTRFQIDFLIKKTKFYDRFQGELNPRQAKVVDRMFREGLDGFKGGLSAKNYISITKTTRATATRDLQDLLDKGVLRKTGELKHTRYFLKLG